MDLPILLQNLFILAVCGGLLALLRAYFRTERSRRALTRLKRDRLGLLAAGVVALYLLVGLLDCLRVDHHRTGLDLLLGSIPQENGYSAPLASTTYDARNPEPLNSRHLLGTDQLGYDVLVQILKGCRTALLIGGLTSAIYIPVGAFLGVLAGYFRGWVDDVIQYIYSVIASIPGILLLIAILMILGKGLGNMAIALSITAWIGLCRLVRGETFRQATRPYVEAAQALGQNRWRIILFHLLPNVSHLIIINAVLGFSGLVMAEAILSYLGVGAPVGVASWGSMIDAARMELSRTPTVWWTITAASTALFGLVLALNILGDSLRRAFDPKAA